MNDRIGGKSGSNSVQGQPSPERTGPRKAIKIKRQDTPAATSHVQGTKSDNDAALFVNTGKIDTASFETKLDPNAITQNIENNGGIVAAGFGKKPRTTKAAFGDIPPQPLNALQTGIQDTLAASNIPMPAALGARRTVNLTG